MLYYAKHLTSALLTLIAVMSAYSEEGLATADGLFRIALTGMPTGGQLTIGSMSNPEITISVNTTAGQSIADVFAIMAIQPIPANCPISTMKKAPPCFLDVGEDVSMIFVRTTDSGIIPAPSPSGFNARPVHAQGEVRLSWTLPHGIPLEIEIFRGYDRIAKLDGSVVTFIDHIAADQKVEADIKYQITCSNRVGWTRIPSDYAEVNSTNPNSMVNDVFEIIAHATSGTKGEPYKEVLEKNGGTDPAVWTLAGGSLPAGITLSPSGIISGTPTIEGTNTFTVAVTDFTGQVASRAVTLAISKFPKLNQLKHGGEGEHGH